jgi:hypothetical protein
MFNGSKYNNPKGSNDEIFSDEALYAQQRGRAIPPVLGSIGFHKGDLGTNG